MQKKAMLPIIIILDMFKSTFVFTQTQNSLQVVYFLN